MVIGSILTGSEQMVSASGWSVVLTALWVVLVEIVASTSALSKFYYRCGLFLPLYALALIISAPAVLAADPAVELVLEYNYKYLKKAPKEHARMCMRDEHVYVLEYHGIAILKL